MTNLATLLDTLAAEYGPAEPIPSTDGWRLVLAENIGYLVADDRRWAALAELERTVGLAPEEILAASDDDLMAVVVGARPAERVDRLRRCARLAIAGAGWGRYPGIGQPGVQRIELFTGERAVLALDSNGLRVLVRLGYGTPGPNYTAEYRLAQEAATAELSPTVQAFQRAHQLLRRHGRTVCRRSRPSCSTCPLAPDCPAAEGEPDGQGAR